MSRQTIEEKIDADTGRLYGPIDGAIQYLKDMKAKYGSGVSLDEHWSGYEDMDMVFVFTREETDAEMNRRIGIEKERERMAAEEAKRVKARKADMAELERLKRKLGVR